MLLVIKLKLIVLVLWMNQALAYDVGNIFNGIVVVFRIMRVLTDIYYGKVKNVWGVPIEDWSIVKEEEERIEEYKKSLEAQLDYKIDDNKRHFKIESR